MEHAWERGKKNKKTGTWQVPQTQEGYDTQWSVDYGVGERAGKGRNFEDAGNAHGNFCGAVIGLGDVNRGLAQGAANDDYPDCCGRRAVKEGIFKLRLDDDSVLTCYRCGLHGGESAGGTTGWCLYPSCNKPNTGSAFPNDFFLDQSRWYYCGAKCVAADAPRRALFEKIRDKLGKNDTNVQAKLKDLNARHNKKNDNMTPEAALAQLKNILAAGTLQAVQDALDAGPSSAGSE